MCHLSDFSETQLRLLQDGIVMQIAENNNQLYTLEDLFEYSELSKNIAYLERKKKEDDLYQIATQILEAIVKKKMEAIVSYN